METKDLIHAFLLNRSDTYFSHDYDKIYEYEILNDKLAVTYISKLGSTQTTERFDLLEYFTFIYNYKNQ